MLLVRALGWGNEAGRFAGINRGNPHSWFRHRPLPSCNPPPHPPRCAAKAIFSDQGGSKQLTPQLDLHFEQVPPVGGTEPSQLTGERGQQAAAAMSWWVVVKLQERRGEVEGFGVDCGDRADGLDVGSGGNRDLRVTPRL